MNNSAEAEYTAVALEEEDTQRENANLNFQSPFDYVSVFDFRSIAQFQKASFPSKSYFTFSKQSSSLDSANHASAERENCLVRLISAALIAVLWSLVLLTLPVSGWWAIRRLPQWQRMVVFRLGKALPVRGPGWTMLLPVLDKYETVDLRNRAIHVPPQQLITSDGAVAELGAEVWYRVCDAPTFVGACVQPETMLRSLSRSVLVSTLAKQQLGDISRKTAEVEEVVLLSINSQLKERGMEASSVKLSEVKVYKEPEHLPSVGPVLRHLGSMFGGGADFSPMIAGQAPLNATWCPPAVSLAADAETSASEGNGEIAVVLREAVTGLPAEVGLAAGRYRIQTTEPTATYLVSIADDCREVRETSVASEHDVAVTLTSQDLRQLMAGDLSPVSAYSAGRLDVQGNIHLLMALGALLKR